MDNTSNESDKVHSVTEVSSLAQYIEWVKKINDGNMLFRGMANAEWRVKSSLYRRLEFNLKEDINIGINSMLFLEMNQKLINDARREGHGRKHGHELNDLELLANLQHYGAATCMIDFTTHSLIALSFACETHKKDNQNIDGKVVAFNSNDNSYNEVLIEETDEKIEHFLQNKKLWILPPKKLNNRIASQQSVFVFGSPFLSEKLHVCKIKAECKKTILEELKKNGISAGMLFDDFVGFSSLNSPDKKYEHWETDSGFVSGIIKLFKKESDNKNLESAIEAFNDEISSNSKYSSLAYFYSGYAKNKLGKFEDAIHDYDSAIKLNPKYWAAYNNRGLAKKKKFEKAINDKKNINDYSEAKDAINDYSEAIKLNSKHSLAYYNRGLAKYELAMIIYKTCGVNEDNLDKFQEAISDFGNAIRLNSNFHKAYHNRGVAKNKLGDEEGAAADFITAKKLKAEI